MKTEDCIIRLENKNFNEIKTITDLNKITRNTLITIIGIIFIIIGLTQSENNKNLYDAFITIGTILSLTGIILLIMKSKSKIYTITKSKIENKSLLFDIKDKQLVISLIENKDILKDSDIKQNQNGSIRLDIMKSKDCQFIALQLMIYSSYVFEAESEVKIYSGYNAIKISKIINSIK